MAEAKPRRPDSWRFKHNQMSPEEVERFKRGIAETAKAMLNDQERRDFYARRPELRPATDPK